ncbi:murein transglycosylase [Blastomyces gilchristii SLH14081]|uniref:Murein transglycosylase n=1 Tax=Blastomyces gilchristii (strain SLH14081) TaxID=559298 RepID=A0A179UHM2_BLAGS|nr:murein transglycosylase [Blastomyces gilchristii SLH14081]OAT07494.1 murein transglycosylase [Blastomyces gilchristii SLH14081]
MSIFKPAALLWALASLALVDAHGTVTGILADGNYIGGYLIGKYPYIPNPPAVAGWSTTATDNGFVDGSSYTSPNIICHRDAQPGAATAEVSAGSTIELQWTEWPESHHGPVLDYLANCNGDCSKVDKTSLEFFKIQEAGLVDGSKTPGKWASDDLIANNNTWRLTIPSTIAPGNYVLRHEIIALHSAHEDNGAQNYPQCFNLKITGSGTANPQGKRATTLYKSTDPGIKINIYNPLNGYEIPGPALFNGGESGNDQGPGPSEPSAPVPSPSASPTATADVTPITPIVTLSPDATPSVPSSAPAIPTVTGRCSARYNKRLQRPHPREFNRRR